MLFIHAHLVTMEPVQPDQTAPAGEFVCIPDGFLQVSGQKISAMGPMSQCPNPDNEEVIDLAGKKCIRLYRCPLPYGTCRGRTELEGDDLNEITDPVTPHLRGIDAINPLNQSFDEALDAAVTTVSPVREAPTQSADSLLPSKQAAEMSTA